MSITIKCLSCGAENRVEEDIDELRALCGKCKAALPLPKLNHPIPLTDDQFESFLDKTSKAVLVDFWASWCAPCRILAPVLEEFSKLHPTLVVAKVDIQANQLSAQRFQVSLIPTLILFKDKKEVKRLTGNRSLRDLENELRPWLTSA